jgi:hypothetical protein
MFFLECNHKKGPQSYHTQVSELEGIGNPGIGIV